MRIVNRGPLQIKKYVQKLEITNGLVRDCATYHIIVEEGGCSPSVWFNVTVRNIFSGEKVLLFNKNHTLLIEQD